MNDYYSICNADSKKLVYFSRYTKKLDINLTLDVRFCLFSCSEVNSTCYSLLSWLINTHEKLLISDIKEMLQKSSTECVPSDNRSSFDFSLKLLPKADGGEEPLPEGIFWLLMTGEIPTKQQVRLMNFYWLLDCNFPKGNTVVLRLGHWSQDEGGSSSCVVFLGKTPNFYSTSFYSRV